MFKDSELLEKMDRLQKFAYKLTRHKERAEDLLHSTIVRAIEKKHLFKEGTNLYSWTSKIMYNMFVTDYRRRVKYETQYDPESFIEKQSIDAGQPVKLKFKRTCKEISNLSDEHQAVMVMICINGMKYQDVSKKLGIPVGTVRSRLSRARANLNENLSKRKAA